MQPGQILDAMSYPGPPGPWVATDLCTPKAPFISVHATGLSAASLLSHAPPGRHPGLLSSHSLGTAAGIWTGPLVETIRGLEAETGGFRGSNCGCLLFRAPPLSLGGSRGTPRISGCALVEMWKSNPWRVAVKRWMHFEATRPQGRRAPGSRLSTEERGRRQLAPCPREHAARPPPTMLRVSLDLGLPVSRAVSTTLPLVMYHPVTAAPVH